VYQKAINKKVRIGYFDSYDTMPATSAMRRGVEIARAALEKQGYELVKIKFSEDIIKEAGIVYTGLVLSNSMAPILDRINDNYDDIMPCYKYSVILLRSGIFMRSLFIAVLRMTGNQRMANAVAKCKRLTPEENEDLTKRQKDLQIKMVQLWSDWNVEAIIQPSYVSVAFKNKNA
jgi:Asp-tRNA(Asn)/Glu-tRNA(Gln) amidotransferase A subunit family amidase